MCCKTMCSWLHLKDPLFSLASVFHYSISLRFSVIISFVFLSLKFLLETCQRRHKSQNPDLEFGSNFLTRQHCDIPQCDWDSKNVFSLSVISGTSSPPPPPNSLSINMGLTKLICLAGVLNIPPKKYLFIKRGNIIGWFMTFSNHWSD